MRVADLFLASLFIAACGNGESAPPPVQNESARLNFQQWSLPKRLDEISGLALTSDERLLAMTDEVAVIYEIDYSAGGLVKAFGSRNGIYAIHPSGALHYFECFSDGRIAGYMISDAPELTDASERQRYARSLYPQFEAWALEHRADELLGEERVPFARLVELFGQVVGDDVATDQRGQKRTVLRGASQGTTP